MHCDPELELPPELAAELFLLVDSELTAELFLLVDCELTTELAPELALTEDFVDEPDVLLPASVLCELELEPESTLLVPVEEDEEHAAMALAATTVESRNATFRNLDMVMNSFTKKSPQGSE